LEGAALKERVAAKFGLDLQDSQTMLTIRGRTREKDGQIHTDSAAKLVTILLYLNPASTEWAGQDGCLRLLRSPTDLENYAVEVPPVDGTLLVFPNGPTTWHGHKSFVGRRYAIQLNYMANDSKARYELRRHRLSAVVKRLLPA
jgi:SM-20-related protein